MLLANTEIFLALAQAEYWELGPGLVHNNYDGHQHFQGRPEQRPYSQNKVILSPLWHNNEFNSCDSLMQTSQPINGDGVRWKFMFA